MANSPHVVDVSEADFEQEVIRRSFEQPVVVDFWAPWCGPCRTLGPILERLADEGKGAFRLAKLNTDENQQLAARYNIRGIPAVKAFKDGQVASEFVGAQPEPNVRRFLSELGADGSGAGTETAAARLLAEHRWAEAETAYRPTGDAVGLARALLGQGKAAEALVLLDGAAADTPAAITLRPLAQFISAAAEAPEGNEEHLDDLMRQAGTLAGEGRFAPAMDALLAVMRKDKRYRNDTPRRVLLAVFDLLGDQDPLTREYRGKLASVLF
jgi:putative thioredoxin